MVDRDAIWLVELICGHNSGLTGVYWSVRMRSSATDAQLLALAGSDPDAFASFYERHERPVVSYVMGQVRNPEVAADLTAEVFAAALEAAARYQPVRESAAPWLMAIAHNALVSSLRRRRVEEAARQRIVMLEVIELRADSLRRVEHAVPGFDGASAKPGLAQWIPAP